jgi:hypothetical protein
MKNASMIKAQQDFITARDALATARAARETETAHLFVEGANFSDDEITALWTASTEKHRIGDLVKRFDVAQAALADRGVQEVARRTPSKKHLAERARFHDVNAFVELVLSL